MRLPQPHLCVLCIAQCASAARCPGLLLIFPILRIVTRGNPSSASPVGVTHRVWYRKPRRTFQHPGVLLLFGVGCPHGSLPPKVKLLVTSPETKGLGLQTLGTGVLTMLDVKRK